MSTLLRLHDTATLFVYSFIVHIITSSVPDILLGA